MSIIEEYEELKNNVIGQAQRLARHLERNNDLIPTESVDEIRAKQRAVQEEIKTHLAVAEAELDGFVRCLIIIATM